MKQLFLFILGFVTLSLTSKGQQATWKEMDEFHQVMSSSFHPTEENNFQPLKEKAGDLVNKAKAWKSSVVPQGYNAALTKPILKKLVQQCTAIKKSVKNNAPDNELKTMITKAHDIFHEVMEKCKE